MSDYFIEPLWSQGGGEQIIGVIIFLLLVVGQILKAYFDARSVQTGEEKTLRKPKPHSDLEESLNQVSFSQATKPPRERKRISRKSSLVTETISENARKTRGTLSRELAPQGEGSRFETTTGTLHSSQIIAPSIEPTVQPMLESMTGIYETASVASENQSQSLTLDVQKLLAGSEGLRQAVILAEILKRPNF
ncbi:MAG: hypothetical protein LBI18_12240 [Planctomycetaceae bacterium]|jgi:hypothetical protein|nr:hypothetical protein [Planctomycetaceae bacterium]